jgi:protein-L-isoaspartate(D-aspartate) O-methyltransferase
LGFNNAEIQELGMKQRPGFPVKLDASDQKKIDKKSVSLNWIESDRTGSSLNSASFTATGLGLVSSVVRKNMVRRLADSGVEDNLVLTALETVERHQFIDTALANQAYEDTSLPIGFGQTISKPNVVARMLELLRQGKNLRITGKLGRVLEIGTGCGYQAALLSQLATEVYSIERVKGLHDRARENLRSMRIANLHLLFGDGMIGYPAGAPYSGIIAAAGGDNIPQSWLDQLDEGGRIVAPMVVIKGTQSLIVIDKIKGEFRKSILEQVNFVPLKAGTD